MSEIPPELLQPLLELWRIEQPITVQLLPRDAWTICAIVQFASRNPALSAEQHRLITEFGRALQRAVAGIDPRLNPYLEMGWNPEHDVPNP
jgi:hypothetical protein